MEQQDDELETGLLIEQAEHVLSERRAGESYASGLSDLEEGASSLGSVFTLCNSAIGAGVLSLPYAFKCAGAEATSRRCVSSVPSLASPRRDTTMFHAQMLDTRRACMRTHSVQNRIFCTAVVLKSNCVHHCISLVWQRVPSSVKDMRCGGVQS